jgi:thiopeptide-type bacteriocin biosynthesis protein
MAVSDTQASRVWAGIHVHFDGPSSAIYGDECDHVLREIVFPTSRNLVNAGLADGYFFVRYAEEGCHIRLRLCSKNATLVGNAEAAFVDELHSLCPEISAHRVGKPARAAARPTICAVRSRPYTPEVDRYGGPFAMPIAEDAFVLSSSVASAIIDRDAGKHRDHRLGQATLVALVLSYALARESRLAAALCWGYRDGFLGVVARTEQERLTRIAAFENAADRHDGAIMHRIADAWARLQHEQSLSETLDAYLQGLLLLRRRFETVTRTGAFFRGTRPIGNLSDVVMLMGPSLLHMMNNRLGIPLAQESYLGHLVARAIAMASGAASPS